MKMPTEPKSELSLQIAEAGAEVTRLYHQIQTAQSLDRVAQKALAKKFTAASGNASRLQTLASMGEDIMTKRVEFAAEARQRAAAFGDSPRGKSILAKALKLEREYRLWCAHHGKEPVLLPAIPPPRPTLPKNSLVAPLVCHHGGRRPGAGRKPLGKKQLLLRVNPATWKRIKEVTRKAGFDTPGEWLDAQLAKVI